MVRVYSRLLEETVVCVEDGNGAPAEPDRVLYTRSEVERLCGLDPDTVRAVHDLKKHFGGRYTGPSPSRNRTPASMR